MEQKTTIQGHIVSYDSELHDGIYYLSMILPPNESKVFFDEAFNRESATFEDHRGYKFKLAHHGGEYELTRA